jgi:manganese/zinc/iron transport system permease protein
MNVFETIGLIFTDYTLRNVALGAAILGIVSGALSTFAVLRKQSLLGDAMSHAALPGVVGVFILTGLKTPLALMAGAIVAGWLGVSLVSVVVRETRVKYDSALGIVLAVFFGFGMVLLTWLQGQNNAGQSGLDTFLFGRAASIIESDVVTMAALGGVVMLVTALFWKEFKLLSFDGQYAATLGFPVRHLDTLLTTLIVVAVVLGLQMVGVVLMSAMIVAPAAAARQWTDRLSLMLILSSAFGALAGVSGAVISSLTNNLPTGPTIVLCISAIVIVSLLFAPNRGIVWGWLRARRNRHSLQKAMLLEKLYDETHRGTHAALPSARMGFILQGGRLDAALAELAADGYIHAESSGQWTLTRAGIEAAETLQGPGGLRESVLFAQSEAVTS